MDLHPVTNILRNINNTLTFLFFVLQRLIFHCYKNIRLLQLNLIISQILILFPLPLFTVKINWWKNNFNFVPDLASLTIVIFSSESILVLKWVVTSSTLHKIYLDVAKHVSEYVLSNSKIFSFSYMNYIYVFWIIHLIYCVFSPLYSIISLVFTTDAGCIHCEVGTYVYFLIWNYFFTELNILYLGLCLNNSILLCID